MKFALVILFVSIFGKFSAQTANAIFYSQNNEDIQVTINNIKQHANHHKSLNIKGLTGNQPYNVKVNFKNDTSIVKTNIYLIDNGLTHIYRVNKKSIQLEKVIPSASSKSEENEIIVNYTPNELILIDTLIADTTEQDTAYVVPFETYYHLEDYEGRIGCPFPIKIEQQAELRGIILSESLEESKLEKVKIAIQDMDSACVMVDQTKELIVLLEFEETRLDFAKFMYHYTFDIDNYGKLNEVFDFDNSKDELKAFINKD